MSFWKYVEGCLCRTASYKRRAVSAPPLTDTEQLRSEELAAAQTQQPGSVRPGKRLGSDSSPGVAASQSDTHSSAWTIKSRCSSS